MDIRKLKIITDKEENVSIEQNKLYKIYEEVVSPMKKQLAEEFLKGFQKHFKEMDFEAKEIINGKAVVSYKNLSFSAHIDANDSIHILGRDKEIAQIKINFNNGNYGESYTLPQDELDKEIVKLDKELERIKKQVGYYQNPQFYFTISSEREIFTNHESLLSHLFPYKD